MKMKRIDNVTARQVTFSKRRRGIFKKAHELSVLCDAEVALIIFSATGKLFEFSSSSMKDILERWNIYQNNSQQLECPSLELQLENIDNRITLSKEVEDKSFQLRQMVMDVDLQGLTLDELQLLENNLEAGLTRVRDTKEYQLVSEIAALQYKGAKMVNENKQLHQKMMKLQSKGKSLGVMESENMNNIASTSNAGPSVEVDCFADTSLRLGLSGSSS